MLRQVRTTLALRQAWAAIAVHAERRIAAWTDVGQFADGAAEREMACGTLAEQIDWLSPSLAAAFRDLSAPPAPVVAHGKAGHIDVDPRHVDSVSEMLALRRAEFDCWRPGDIAGATEWRRQQRSRADDLAVEGLTESTCERPDPDRLWWLLLELERGTSAPVRTAVAAVLSRRRTRCCGWPRGLALSDCDSDLQRLVGVDLLTCAAPAYPRPSSGTSFGLMMSEGWWANGVMLTAM